MLPPVANNAYQHLHKRWCHIKACGRQHYATNFSCNSVRLRARRVSCVYMLVELSLASQALSVWFTVLLSILGKAAALPHSTSISMAHHSTSQLSNALAKPIAPQASRVSQDTIILSQTSDNRQRKVTKHASTRCYRSDARLLTAVQVPKPPKKDFYKLMNKDKIVLRFSTRFVETPTHQLSSSDRSDHPSV